MKRTLWAGGIFAVLCSTVAQAGVSVLGSVGLDTLTQTEPTAGKDDEYKGLSLGALARFDFVNLGVAGIYGGAGLRYLSVSHEESGVKASVGGSAAEFELGGRFSLVPALLSVEGGVVYDFGLSGKSKVEAGSLTIENDLESLSRLGIGARGLVSLAPFVQAGLELGYNTAAVKVKNVSGEAKFNGYNVRAVVSVGL